MIPKNDSVVILQGEISCWLLLGFNHLTPKIGLLILPSRHYTFPCNLIIRVLRLDQDNFYETSLSIPITYLLDNVWIPQREVTIMLVTSGS